MELGTVLEIPCEKVRPFPGQPRKYFNKRRMEELIASIRAVGQRAPGTVKLLSPTNNGHAYELVDGERRLRACTVIGTPFRAWVKEDATTMDERDQFLESVILNLSHEPHTELEILRAILKIKKDFNLTIQQTADRLGHSVSWVVQYLSLQKLVPEVLEMMSPELPETERLTFSHALLIATLTPEVQCSVAKTVVQGRLKIKEVRFMVAQVVGRPRRSADWSPRKEHQKFLHFLERTGRDLGLFLREPPDYFRKMFEYRPPADLAMASAMARKVMTALAAVRERLEDGL